MDLDGLVALCFFFSNSGLLYNWSVFTIASQVPLNNGVEMDPNPVPSSPLLSGQEPISNASSICSRKDSGIKSNSRRSSIQQQVQFFPTFFSSFTVE